VKIYIPVLTQYARHGGVTQFLANFSTVIIQYSPNHRLFDHTGEITQSFSVTTFDKFRAFIRKVILIKSLVLFPWKLKKMDHVFLNPSLGHVSMKREMYYAKCCIEKNKNFSVFFHGWNWNFSELLDSNIRLKSKYVKILNSAENVFVLGETFKDKLVEWGVTADKIVLEKTTVPDDFLPNVTKKNFSVKKLNILFLSRISRAKGIFEAVDAFSLHLKDYPNSIFNIAGTGEDLHSLEVYVKNNNIQNINFLGFADEEKKKQLMKDNDVFILPSYSEGMPISIFEAMGYGLTIVTRPVGGIPDYFIDNKMGFMIDSLDPKEFSDALNITANDIALRENISNFNHDYIKGNVTASIVTKRILSKMEHVNEN
jgi:glycosyltransferase involved in cell wall biosynthesis